MYNYQLTQTFNNTGITFSFTSDKNILAMKNKPVVYIDLKSFATTLKAFLLLL